MYKKSKSHVVANNPVLPALDYNLRLRIGKLQFVFLNKVLWDFTVSQRTCLFWFRHFDTLNCEHVGQTG